MPKEVDEYTQGWRNGRWGTVLDPEPRHINKRPKFNHIPEAERWDPDHVRDTPGRIFHDPLNDVTNGQPHGYVWTEDGDIFVAFNTSLSRVKIPPRVRYGRRSMYEMGQMEWEQPGFPYLPYLSVAENFNGRLLRRLAIDKNHFPTSMTFAGTIMMDKNLVNSWVRLEDNFLRMIDIYKARTKFQDIKFLPLPKSRKLYDEYLDKETLFRDALATRDRFVMLCAILSFFVSIRRDRAKYEHRLDPHSPGDICSWLQFQAEPISAGVHPQWVTMILDSSIVWGRTGVKRRGVIIDYRKSEFSVLVPYMVAYGVPVVLRMDKQAILDNVDIALQERILNMYRNLNYPDITVDRMNHFLRKFIPSPDVIKSVREPCLTQQIKDGFSFQPQLDDSASELESGQMSWNSAPGPPARASSSADASSNVETREEFLARRDREREAAILVEGPEERIMRLNRENGTKDFQVPGPKQKKRTKVFFWEWDGKSETRILVDPDEYENLWTEFGRSEMHYDSVRDEWDIWIASRSASGFRPAGMDEVEDIATGQLISGDTILAPNFNNDLFRQDLLNRLDMNLERFDGHYVEAARTKDFLPLMDRMGIWYGYVQDVELSEKARAEVPEKLNVERLRHALHDSITPVDPKQISGIQRFFTNLMVRSSHVPPSHDTFNTSIVNFGNPRVVVRRSRNRAKEFEDPRSPFITLYSVEVVDKHGIPQSDRKDRRLFVWNATVALAVKRIPFDRIESLENIALVLLEHGIPFILAFPQVRLPGLTWDPRCQGLVGTWTPGTKNDPLHFKAYLVKIRELFSVLRVKKFLRYGGILWRLARLHLDIHDGLAGPSFEALNEPQRLDGPGDLVDDGVTKTEWEILTGTFEVIRNNAKEPVRYSYWPPPYIWSSRGHNVGPWSPDNEDWFIMRFQLYMAGKAQLYTVDEWRVRAGGFKETKALMKALEGISERFIDS